jgi:hypothetical protein
MTLNNQSVAIVPHQLPLCPALPVVKGSKEFVGFCALLNRIDELLHAGIEAEFVSQCLQIKRRKRTMTDFEQIAYQTESRRALRCNIVRHMLQESFRDFCCHLAESAVLQRFCGFLDLVETKVPSHSQLHRYESWLPEADIRELITALMLQAEAGNATETLGLESPIDMKTAWLDSTCAKTNAHFPVDWLLLRDLTHTMLKAIIVLRKHDVKHRMPDPKGFYKQINRLCIKMTHVGKGEKRKIKSKEVFREMRDLVNVIGGHAERYLEKAKSLPQGWAVGACKRLRNMLDMMPAAIFQASERIIGERQVENSVKIFSLYEPDTAILTRGKSGAKNEFGHSLFIVEQRDGLIVDWQLPKKPKSDVVFLQEGIKRWQETYGKEMIKVAVSDRGFDGDESRSALKDAGMENGMCPRSVAQLINRLSEPEFCEQQRRRSQTEARIAIIKNNFLDGRLSTKGHENHEKEIAWVVLAHNLWVLARLKTVQKC